NGATFQLVPHRWAGRTGLMSGIVGAAGGIGGFYLPVVMGIAKESTGSYQLGFATFGVLAAVAFVLVATLQRQWLAWALTSQANVGLDGAVAIAEGGMSAGVRALRRNGGNIAAWNPSRSKTASSPSPRRVKSRSSPRCSSVAAGPSFVARCSPSSTRPI